MPNGTPTLEEFLHKETIGSLTGLTKRFADLDLFDEPRKLPEQYWPHIYLGMLACYLLRERKVRRHKGTVIWDLDNPKHPARRLIDSARDVFDANAAQTYDLLDEIMDPSGEQEHRFHVLMYDYDTIEKLKDKLIDRLGAKRIRLSQTYSVAAAVKKYPLLDPLDAVAKLKETRRQSTYRNLTQLMGIDIADGSIRQALEIAGDLDQFSDREARQSYGISSVVATYLRDGGAKTLSRRAAGPGFLVNKYWYRNTFGTKKHPGKFYNLLNESRNEIVIGTAVGYLIGKFGDQISPILHDGFHAAQQLGESIAHTFGG